MYGWYKLEDDTKYKMIIAYSWEKDKSCDGRLIFNKQTEEMKVEKMSVSADEFATSYFICPLRSRIRKGMELDRRYIVAIG